MNLRYRTLEKRQFDSADDLLKCMAFDAITAWRVLDLLQRMAKYEPLKPAAEVVDEDTIQMLGVLLHDIDRRHEIRPPPDLTIRQFVINQGRLAGFRPSRKQPLPGTKKIWQGEKELMGAMRAYEALKRGNYLDENAWSRVGS